MTVRPATPQMILDAENASSFIEHFRSALYSSQTRFSMDALIQIRDKAQAYGAQNAELATPAEALKTSAMVARKLTRVLEAAVTIGIDTAMNIAAPDLLYSTRSERTR